MVPKGSERGSSVAVEAALVLPVAMLLVGLVIVMAVWSSQVGMPICWLAMVAMRRCGGPSRASSIGMWGSHDDLPFHDVRRSL